MTPAEVAVRRRLMVSMHGEVLADVAEVMQCDVELCADQLAAFAGERHAYVHAICEEIRLRFSAPTYWTTDRLAAYRKLLAYELIPDAHFEVV